jgi:hypothetical protein
MSQNTAALTLTARNKVAQLGEAISKQRAIIKQALIVNTQKEDSYKCNRARHSLSTLRARYDTLLEKHEATLESFETECEIKVKKLEAECEAKVKEIERTYGSKIQLLRDIVEPDTEAYKTSYEKKMKTLESEMETQHNIIEAESDKTPLKVIQARVTLEILTKELDDIYIANGLMKPPKPQEELDTSQNAPEPSPAFKAFMMDGRQDGQPMSTEKPSYLQGTAWGLCLTKKDKEKRYKNSPE